MPIHSNTSALFAPQSIIVVGPHDADEVTGNIILSNLIQAGYSGTIFSVNTPQDSTLPVVPLETIDTIPQKCLPLDMAIIYQSPQETLASLEQLGKLGLKSAILIGQSFSEIGDQGALLANQLTHIAHTYKIAVLGPNSLGMYVKSTNLHATTAPSLPLTGDIGFFSQAGALCVALADWAKLYGIGFSNIISLGDKAVINESDLIAHLANDPSTKVIAGYVEQIANGPNFLHYAHLATRKKPIILFRSGNTSSGARAASSHTGAFSGTDLAFDAACKQTGVIRANGIEDLFNMAQAFASQPLPKGGNVAIISNSGGLGIMAADACDNAKLSLANLLPSTINTLKELLPSYTSLFNPIDISCSVDADTLAEAVDVVMGDPLVHTVLLLATSSSCTSATEIATAVCKKIQHSEKTFLVTLMGGPCVGEGKSIFSAHGIPCYHFAEPAVRAIAAMYRQSLWNDNPLPVEVNYRRDTSKARDIINAARADGIIELPEFQAHSFLQAYEMPLLEAKLARTSNEAAQIAKQMGKPVALKIASPHISHKTDVQGVALGLDTPEKIKASFLDITNRVTKLRKDAYIAGCLVQCMAPQEAREVIIRFTRDKCFGPMISFGVGGIHMEAFKDISCRLAPLSLEDVHTMVREIKAFPLLAGIGGQKPVSFTAIEDILLIMSQLALDFSEIAEIDCNPVLIDEQRAYVAGIRILLAPPSKNKES